MATKAYARVTQAGLVCATRGRLSGVFVSAPGTFTLRDSGQSDIGLRAADPMITGPITVTQPGFIAIPVDFQNGIVVDGLTPGTDITIVTE
jgi:hypothetical protein